MILDYEELWKSAPSEADYWFISGSSFFRQHPDNHRTQFYMGGRWVDSEHIYADLVSDKRFVARPNDVELYAAACKEWPTDEQRINIIGSNAPSGEHYDTPDWSQAPVDATHWGRLEGQPYFWKVKDLQTYYWTSRGDFYELKYSPKIESVREFIATLIPRPVTVENTEPKSHGFVERAVTANKYDRTIHGKYGTGSVTVDVYRVLNAFGPLSPEIDHSVKKLLAAGTRGAKSERQGLLEAIQSIEARLQYLEARDGDVK